MSLVRVVAFNAIIERVVPGGDITVVPYGEFTNTVRRIMGAGKLVLRGLPNIKLKAGDYKKLAIVCKIGSQATPVIVAVSAATDTPTPLLDV